MTSITVETFKTSPSVLTRLEATYSKDTPENTPHRLLLKEPKPYKAERLLREVRFYVSVAPVLDPALSEAKLVRCLTACEGVVTNEGTITEFPWLVLEDASATHRAVPDGTMNALHLG